jgi:hypothetical protein
MTLDSADFEKRFHAAMLELYVAAKNLGVVPVSVELEKRPG